MQIQIQFKIWLCGYTFRWHFQLLSRSGLALLSMGKQEDSSPWFLSTLKTYFRVVILRDFSFLKLAEIDR